MTEPTKTDHAYDGIEEYDNPLPGWWKWLFIASIVFCPFYWMYYHGDAEGRSIQDQYDVALSANTRLQFAEVGDLEPNRETIVRYTAKENWVKVGRIVFKTNCISCHGRDGEGKIGPNLTDEFYKNVTNIEDIAKVIAKGAGNNAMPAWSNRLHPNEIVLVSSYIATLRGTNVDGGKAPEGKEIDPWPQPPEEPDDETNGEADDPADSSDQ
ncbi:MAG: c-type cytochrome [Pirellulaceae bacterium]|nr:c-type cytochrome [Pirellulaceae bacterium]